MFWIITYWTLLSFAIATAFYALFWDRPGWRGRPKLRCKKCWYDLTESPGDLRVEPIQCPECGKKHPSRKSMRKTRRSKKWIVIALVLFMGSYTAGVWPRVSKYNYSNGILGAVPTPVLILAIPTLPDEPGTKVDRNTPATAIPIKKRPMGERIAHQLMIRLYESKDTSQLDHWLFMRVAKRESASGLTDPTSIRGEVYRYVFDAWDRQRRLSYEEERWARSVYELEIKHAEYGIESEPAYANIRVRRLLDRGRWRVRIHKTLYETVRQTDWKTYNAFRELSPVDLQLHGWWDGAACIYDMNVRNNGFWGGSPPTTFERTISGTIYDGDPYADIWWPASEFEERIEYKIAEYTRNFAPAEVLPPGGRWSADEQWVVSMSGSNVIQDPKKHIAWIRSHIKVSFGHDEDVPFGVGLPENLSLSVRDNFALKDKLGVEPFTFGGTIKVVIQTREGGRIGDELAKEHMMVVMESDDAWWALRDELDKQGLHVFEGKWKRARLKVSRGFERYEHGGVFSHGGMTVAANDEVIGGFIEIRFGGKQGYSGGFRTLADLDAKQVLTAPVRLPLSRSKAGMLKHAVQSDTFRMGYKDLYTEEELKDIEVAYPSRTWTSREKDPAEAGQ